MSSERPAVSVLLPARDAARHLDVCLRSLERQRETRWECILVDDGSLDATPRIAREHAARDPRLRLVTGPRRGLIAALHEGLAHCRAPLVARMDADDWMHRDRLGAQLAHLERHPELAGVGCHVRLFPRPHLGDGRRRYEAWLNGLTSEAAISHDRFVECPLAHPTWMIRRGPLAELGYRDRGWPEDYDLLLRLLARGHRLGVVPRRLVGWRDHDARLSRCHPAYAIERFTECKAAHLATGFLARAPQYILWGYGDTGRSLRRALARHDRRPSHIVELHPGRLGQRIHGAPVVAPERIPDLPRRPLVASVAGAEARERIRAALSGMGLREMSDFVCAA
ncbi:MAG: glycosyltransferase family 2 protein [Myxococcota bacterium]